MCKYSIFCHFIAKFFRRFLFCFLNCCCILFLFIFVFFVVYFSLVVRQLFQLSSKNYVLLCLNVVFAIIYGEIYVLFKNPFTIVVKNFFFSLSIKFSLFTSYFLLFRLSFPLLLYFLLLYVILFLYLFEKNCFYFIFFCVFIFDLRQYYCPRCFVVYQFYFY